MQLDCTIDIEHATSVDWDTVVVGAGPAGAIAAHQIARRGLRVLVLDKDSFPRGKVCGGCLNQRSLALLQAASLGDLPHELGGQPLRSLRMSATSRSATVPLHGGVSLSRRTFDVALVEAAISAGAEFIPRVRVRDTALQDERRVVMCQSSNGTPHLITAKILVAANGLTSRIGSDVESSTSRVWAGSRIGAGVTTTNDYDTFEAGTIYMACGRHGYLGVVRVEHGQLDIAAALDPAAVKQLGGLGSVAAAVAADARLPHIHDLEQLAWQGTPLLTRQRSEVASTRMFVVGDAAGYVEPFTGEGIAWALATGTAVVDFAEAGCVAWNNDLVSSWQHTHRRVVRQRQWLIRGLAATLRSPRLTRLLVRALAASPSLARPFIHWLDAMPTPVDQPPAGAA